MGSRLEAFATPAVRALARGTALRGSGGVIYGDIPEPTGRNAQMAATRQPAATGRRAHGAFGLVPCAGFMLAEQSGVASRPLSQGPAS